MAVKYLTDIDVIGTIDASENITAPSFQGDWLTYDNSDAINWNLAYSWGNHASAGYEDTTNKNQNGGYAGLDGAGKIPTSLLPDLAITETFVVNSGANMLALSAQTGDIAVRTDVNETYILAGSDPTVLADWQKMLTPTDAVNTVNGLAGNVQLDLSFSNGDLSLTGSSTTIDLDARYQLNTYTEVSDLDAVLKRGDTSTEGATFGKAVKVVTDTGIQANSADASSNVIMLLDSSSHGDLGGLAIKTGDNNGDENAIYVLNHVDDVVFKVNALTGNVVAASYDGDGSLLTDVNAQTLDNLDSTDFLKVANDLSDLNDVPTALTNLGLDLDTILNLGNISSLNATVGQLTATDGLNASASGTEVLSLSRSGGADLVLSASGSGNIDISHSGSGTILQDETTFRGSIDASVDIKFGTTRKGRIYASTNEVWLASNNDANDMSVIGVSDTAPLFQSRVAGVWGSVKNILHTGNFIAGTDYQTPLSNVAFTNVNNNFSAGQTIANSAPTLSLKDTNASDSASISAYLGFKQSDNTQDGYVGFASDDIQIWSRNGEINLLKNTNVTGDLDVNGNVEASGSATFGGITLFKNPSSTLRLSGAPALEGDVVSKIDFFNEIAGTGVGASISSERSSAWVSGDLVFRTSSAETERMRILNEGGVEINGNIKASSFIKTAGYNLEGNVSDTSNTDLNTITGFGFYNNLQSTAAPNRPQDFSYIQNIKYNNDNMLQYAHPYRAGSEKIRYRTRFSGAWSGWETIATEAWVSDNFSELVGDNLAFTNVDNNFSVGQTIVGGLDVRAGSIIARSNLQINNGRLYQLDGNSSGFNIKDVSGGFDILTTDTNGNHNFGTGTGTFGGNVGIGTTPLRDFHVHNDGLVTQLHITSGTTTTAVNRGFDLIQNNGVAEIVQRENNSFRIYTNSLNRYEINANGNHDFKNGTATFGGAVTLASTSNTFNGHLYYNAFDANGNHYPQYKTGSNNNGVKVNKRYFVGDGSTFDTHTINSDTKAMTFADYNLSDINNLTANNFIGNGSGLTNVNAKTLNGQTNNTNAIANTIASRTGDGSLFATSFNGNGSQLTDVDAETLDGLTPANLLAGKKIGSTNYRIRAVIPLYEIANNTIPSKHIIGQFIAYRPAYSHNAEIMDVNFRYSVHAGGNQNSVYWENKGDFELVMEPVVFNYNSKRYFGIRINSDVINKDIYFKGLATEGIGLSPINELDFNLVEYYNFDNSTVLNSEINSSITTDIEGTASDVTNKRNKLKFNNNDIYHTGNDTNLAKKDEANTFGLNQRISFNGGSDKGWYKDVNFDNNNVGWARLLTGLYNTSSSDSGFNIGVLGSGETYNYTYLGYGGHDALENLRIAPNGDITGQNFIGAWNGKTTGSFILANEDDNFTGALYKFLNTSAWQVSVTDGAYQRVDARDDGNKARLHWYGIDDGTNNSNYRSAFYDGTSYINFDAENGGLVIGGNLNATGTATFGGEVSTPTLKIPLNGSHWKLDSSTTNDVLRFEYNDSLKAYFENNGTIYAFNHLQAANNVIAGGDLNVTGTATFGGNVNFGTTISGAGNIIKPLYNATYHLGSTSARFKTLYSTGLDVTGTATFGGKLFADADLEVGGRILGKSTDWTKYEIAKGSSFDHVFTTRTNTGAGLERLRITGGAVNGEVQIKNADLDVTGNVTAKSLITTNDGGGNDLLYFDTDRPWKFWQRGDDASASLVLSNINDTKTFAIRSEDDLDYFTFVNINENGSYVTTNYENRLGNNVRIGSTVKPTEALDVTGNVKVSGKGAFGENISSDAQLIVANKTGDIQMRVGSISSSTSNGIHPTIRLQGRNADGSATNYADIKLDTDTQKLIFNDPGVNSGDIGQNPMSLDFAGNLEVNGNVVADNFTVSSSTFTEYTSATHPDINALVSGSTYGAFIEGALYGHTVVGIRENGGSDTFSVVSGGGDWHTDETYDKLVFQVRADGSTTINGNLTLTGASTFSGNVTANSLQVDNDTFFYGEVDLDGNNIVNVGALIIDGGDSAEFLKADGSVDGTMYQVEGEFNYSESTSTGYTISTGNKGDVVGLTGATAITVTINQTSLFAVGDITYIDQMGTGEITFVTGSGTVNLRKNGNMQLKTDGQYSRVAIHKVSTTDYRIFGELKPI